MIVLEIRFGKLNNEIERMLLLGLGMDGVIRLCRKVHMKIFDRNLRMNQKVCLSVRQKKKSKKLK